MHRLSGAEHTPRPVTMDAIYHDMAPVKLIHRLPDVHLSVVRPA